MIKEFSKEIDISNINNVDFKVIDCNPTYYSSQTFAAISFYKKTLFFNIPTWKKLLISNFSEIKTHFSLGFNSFNVLIKENSSKIYKLNELKWKVLENWNYYLVFTHINNINWSISENQAQQNLQNMINTYNQNVSTYNQKKNKSLWIMNIWKELFHIYHITWELIDVNL